MTAVTDYTSLITSEHANKPNFVAVVNALANSVAAITAVAQSLSTDFDLDAATGAQLDIVGQWLGQPRVIPNVITVGFFGFADTVGAATFGELSDASKGGPWWNLGESYTSTTVLGDTLYRQFLYARILRNQFDGTSASLELALEDILGVPVTLQDGNNLTVNITAGGKVDQVLQTIVQQYDILPRPAGVNYTFSFP